MTTPVHDLATVAIRPISAADRESLRCFVEHLSSRTGYQRLLSARKPTPEELRRWAEVDGVREAAFVAMVRDGTDERMVGVARYVRDDASGEADFAIVLADDWQRRGLGKELLGRLIDYAREHHVGRIVGTTLSTNTAMLSLARRLGFRARKSPGSATVTLLELDPSEIGGRPPSH